MEEKNFDLKSFIGFILIGAILLYMMYQNQPSPNDTSLNDQTNQEEVVNKISKNDPKQSSFNLNDAFKKRDVLNSFDQKKYVQSNTLLENELLAIEISNLGGMLSKVRLKNFVDYDSVPVSLIKNGNSLFNLNFSTTDGKNINTSDLYFEPTLKVNGEKQVVSMKFMVSEDQFIEYLYSLGKDDYMIDFSIRSKGLKEVLNNRYEPTFDWKMKAFRLDQSISFENRYTRLSYQYDKDKTDKLSQSGNDDDIIESVSWISYRQHFFSSILVPKSALKSAEIKSFDLVNDETIDTVFTKKYTTKFPIEFDQGELSKKMSFYFGPTYAETLKKYDKNLEASIPFGWGIFGWINKSIFSPLYSWLSGFLSYGIAIIVMTILVKILLSFVQYKQFLSQAKMKILKPELDAIGEKFKSNKMKAQQERMALQNKAGASPLSGCLPGLLQIPVFYSLFMFFPVAFELRQKPFLWVKDLSSYDTVLDLPFNIPFYGDHVSLFPILASIAIFFYMRMTTGQNMNMQPQQEGMPDMAKMMKYMIYFSPLLMLFFFNNYASGLSLYYFVSNLISIGIMLVIKNYIIDEDKVLAKIQVNKSKPKKQNRFQRKMAEIMEQAEKQKAMQQKRKK